MSRLDQACRMFALETAWVDKDAIEDVWERTRRSVVEYGDHLFAQSCNQKHQCAWNRTRRRK